MRKARRVSYCLRDTHVIWPTYSSNTQNIARLKLSAYRECSHRRVPNSSPESGMRFPPPGIAVYADHSPTRSPREGHEASLAACLCHMADWLLHAPCAATRRFEQSCQPKVHCRRDGLHSSTTPDIPVVRKRCHTEFEAGPPDEEKAGAWGSIEKVSRPTIQVFLA